MSSAGSLMDHNHPQAVRRKGGSLLALALMVIPFSLLVQGCFPAVWLAAVGTHSVGQSDVEFQPFQHSWVAPPEMRQQHGSINSIAVAPFPGDPAMATRFTTVLEETTDLRIVNTHQVTKQVDQATLALMSGFKTDEEATSLARRITRDVSVDCVLFGRVVAEPTGKKAWGSWTQWESKRLFLQLVNAEGSTVWRDELPFTVASGLDESDNSWMNEALKRHLVAHTQTLGLTELGRTPAKKGV